MIEDLLQVSKYCSDHLRVFYRSQSTGKLKATHAREIVAAIFGYKSHAGLLHGTDIFPDKAETANFTSHCEYLLSQRLLQLSELPNDLPPVEILVKKVLGYGRNWYALNSRGLKYNKVATPWGDK